MSFARNKRWRSGPLALRLSTIVFAEELLLSETTVGEVPCHADHLAHIGGADRPDYA